VRTDTFTDWVGGPAPQAPAPPSGPPVAGAPAHEDAAVHAAPLSGGGELGRREQAVIALRYGFRQAARNWHAARKHPGGMLNYLEHYSESVADQAAYMNSRAWVPAGHEGGTAEAAGIAFHKWVGIPLGSAFMLGRWVCARPFRFCVATGLLAIGCGAALAMLAHYGIVHL